MTANHATSSPSTVEIEAEVADGVPDDVQRIVNENGQTLRFKAHGFEKWTWPRTRTRNTVQTGGGRLLFAYW